MSDVKRIYSNAVQVGIQPYDLFFAFGTSTAEGIKEEVTVLMSPQHAKAFSQILTEHVNKYEELFGAITTLPITPERIEELTKLGFVFDKRE